MTSEGELTFKKVRVSDKGQISIPVDVQRKVGITKGDELLLIAKDRRIVLEKPSKVAEVLEDEFADTLAITQETLGRLWLNKADDVWEKYLEGNNK